MIKTVPLDLFLNFGLGAGFALSAKEQLLRSHSIFYHRYFLAVVLYETIVFAPIGIFLLKYYPDWSVMYLFDSSSASLLSAIWAIGLYYFAIISGYIYAQTFIKQNKVIGIYFLLALCALGLLGIILENPKRIYYVGTYAQFHSNTASPFYSDLKFILFFLFAGPVFILTAGFLMRWFIMEGKKLKGDITSLT